MLIKLIDARDNLSLQVHPDDDYARKYENQDGKTEMWYILDCEEGASLVFGLREDMTKEQFGSAVLNNNVLEHCNTVPVKKGDVFFIKAGTLHAIGKGILLAEVQQSSNVTYRVYDFGRRDANGNTRELHTELAKDAIDYKVYPEYRSSYDSTLPVAPLVECPYFSVSRVVVQHAQQVDLHTDSFVIVVCLHGDANINGVKVHQGETLLVPASENVLNIFGNATFLTATIR